ncbi:MAG: hypothetical protein H7Y04_06470, partial [Verrucomicrobia bacterium]|nr:hypothetical protein [Cytophagales bacterium]
PFVALFVGLLLTVMLQSTSLASVMLLIFSTTGIIDVHEATFTIVGINIGITLSQTIVATGRTHKRREFRRVISLATIYSFFAICVGLVVLPLEYFFHTFSSLVTFTVSFLGFATQDTNALKNIFSSFYLNQLIDVYPVVGFVAGSLVMVVSFRFFTQQTRNLIEKNATYYADAAFFDNNPFKLLWKGFLPALAIQSGVAATSLIIPAVLSRKTTLRRAYPFIIGAYLGASVMGLWVALLLGNAFALQIALVHLLFRMVGVLLLFPIPQLRYLPVQLSRHLATLTIRNRTMSFVYILLLFFLIPFLLIFFTR